MLLPIIVAALGGAAITDRRSGRSRFGALPMGLPTPWAEAPTVELSIHASPFFSWERCLTKDARGVCDQRPTDPARAINIKVEVDGLVVEDAWVRRSDWTPEGIMLQTRVPRGAQVRVILDGRVSTPVVTAATDLSLDGRGGGLVLVPA